MRIQLWSRRTVLSAVLVLLNSALAQASPPHPELFQCDEPSGILCAEQLENPGAAEGYYVGHDEPALLFYSDQPGSGNSNVYRLTLPKDPPLLPKQNGSGGTWNFQLHPAFWFGMAMCDDQGDPNPGGSPSAGPNIPCIPDSDSNIYDSPNPAGPDYIGRHPGTAFMEMQFYPPGWFFGNSPTQWTAALNIDTFQDNGNTGKHNNPACLAAVGTPYVNFAFIQRDGTPFPAGSPSPLGPFVSTNANTLFMNPGDELIVTLRDTEHGFEVTVRDLTTGQSGFMVASAANGFAQVLWDPNGADCAFATHNLPHDFHPAYATSSEHTRVPGAAHTYNVSFSDEIGHFEYCRSVDSNGVCKSSGGGDPPGLDDKFCFSATLAALFGFVPIGGCIASDVDFDGVPYRNDTWPGSFSDPQLDALYHAQPVIFSSPLFFGPEGDNENYSRVAFEVDLPRIEGFTNPPCQRHLANPADPSPGTGCVNPPVGAEFYPVYTTRSDGGRCLWQLGGTSIPGTQLKFGGTSTTEYGPIQAVFYPAANGHPQYIYENFHNTLSFNPCPTFSD